MNEELNKKLVEHMEELIKNPPEYIIGVDTYSDDYSSSFCLTMKRGEIYETLLVKTEENKDKFIEEVNNLMKYFNATKMETRGK